jgi:Integrase core domain
VTATPTGSWVTQQAHLLPALEEQGRRVRFLLRDRDAKSCRSFDDVFRAEGAEIVLTPVQAPTANADAERWVGTVRAECLDWLLIVRRDHLEQVLRVYVECYNRHRPAPSAEPGRTTQRDRGQQGPPRQPASTGPARRPGPRVPANCMNAFTQPHRLKSTAQHQVDERPDHTRPPPTKASKRGRILTLRQAVPAGDGATIDFWHPTGSRSRPATCSSTLGPRGQFRFFIRGRDARFPDSFAAVSGAEGVQILRTPVRAARANAFAERWGARFVVRCWIGCCSLPTPAGDGADEPCGALQQTSATPRARAGSPPTAVPLTTPTADMRVVRVDRPGGLIHEYAQVA